MAESTVARDVAVAMVGSAIARDVAMVLASNIATTRDNDATLVDNTLQLMALL
jgi:hypothetical protein